MSSAVFGERDGGRRSGKQLRWIKKKAYPLSLSFCLGSSVSVCLSVLPALVPFSLSLSGCPLLSVSLSVCPSVSLCLSLCVYPSVFHCVSLRIPVSQLAPPHPPFPPPSLSVSLSLLVTVFVCLSVSPPPLPLSLFLFFSKITVPLT